MGIDIWNALAYVLYVFVHSDKLPILNYKFYHTHFMYDLSVAETYSET